MTNDDILHKYSCRTAASNHTAPQHQITTPEKTDIGYRKKPIRKKSLFETTGLDCVAHVFEEHGVGLLINELMGITIDVTQW